MLENIEINNFRGITHLVVENFKNINIFLGEPNTGKTSILESIFISIIKYSNSIAEISFLRNMFNDDMFEALFYDYDVQNNITFNYRMHNTNYTIDIAPDFSDEEIIISNNANQNNIKTIDKLNFKIQNGEEFISKIKYINDEKTIKFKLKNQNKINSIKNNIDFIGDYTYTNKLSSNLKTIFADNEKKELFEKLYKKFDAKLKDIRFIETKLVVELDNLKHPINIKAMGKGFQTYIKIIAAMVSEKEYIIIDEIENGMHFKSIKILLENILYLSREYNLQFFVTTHNKELLEILNNILYQNNYDDMISVYNTYVNNENNIDIVNYTQEDFSHFIENDNEMRD